LSWLAGAVIVLFGLHLLGAFRVLWLMREAKLQPSSWPVGVVGAFAMGLAFGFGWTPCVGPVLASILLVAATSDSVNQGAALLAAYSAGIAVPFLAAALLTGPFLHLMAKYRRHVGLIEKTMGAGLIVAGLLISFGAMPVIGAWLQEYLPFTARIG
jgi:cytochrome c-type biogenesis protein